MATELFADSRQSHARLITVTLSAGLAGLAGITAWSVSRRLVGAYVQPVSGLTLLGITAATCLAFESLRHFTRRWHARGHQIVTATALLCLILLVLSVHDVRTPAWSRVTTWLILGGAIAHGLSRRQMPRWQMPRWPIGVNRRLPRNPPDANPGNGSLPTGVSQQLTRTDLEDGESVEGLLRAVFAAGERTTALHVAFCPPLVHSPEVTVAQRSGESVTLKVTQAEKFGCRIELRRSAPASTSAGDVVVHFTACCAGRAPAAWPQ